MIGRVEKWRIVVHNWDLYLPYGVSGPRLRVARFHLEGMFNGRIFIRSSPIVKEDGDCVITASGSNYGLGEPWHNEVRTLAEMCKAYPEVSLCDFPEGNPILQV